MKLGISQPGDRHELEADRVAESVVRSIESQYRTPSAIERVVDHITRPAPDSNSSSAAKGDANISREGTPCVGCVQEQMQKAPQSSATSEVAMSALPSAIRDTVGSPGQPLDAPMRALMEPRFGRDFSRVRIHNDSRAAESAQAVCAKAYTIGPHIAFGRGYYAPEASTGQRLLAHELAHVVQQQGVGGAPTIQRAEVDDRSCAGLTDIETDVNTKVNTEIGAARTAAGTPIAILAFLRDVMTRLGRGAISPIETFIESLPATKRRIPPSNLAGTKYAGVGAANNFYALQAIGAAHVVGSAAKIHGICVGADKLGHFFEEGFTYFRIATTPALGGSAAAADSAGRALEIGIQGLGVGAIVGTGVYSNADQTANRAGMQFYQDLQATPTMVFAISSYITNNWNEQTNPSFYETGVGAIVWNNLLAGAWRGPFTRASGSSAPIDSNVNLAAAASGVTGTYDHPAAAPTQHGTILNGTVTQNTTSVTGTFPGDPAVSATPVSGITINFDWSEGTSTGKGVWTSVNEQTLSGTWGTGTSRTNGGTWRINKI